MMKKIVAFLLAIMMVALTVPGLAAGYKWALKEDVLSFEGTGKMQDYTPGHSPWYNYLDHVKKVVISDGITSIGKYAFYNCNVLTEAHIPDSVTSIGEGAFTGASEDLVIHCNPGSYAEKYAKKNHISYSSGVDIEVEDDLVLLPGLTYRLEPSQPGLTKVKYTYKSSDKSVAAVSKKGVITAKKSGIALITIKSSHGEVADVLVTVEDAEIQLDKTKLTLKKGASYTLKPTQPNAFGPKFTYSSSDKKIATVSSKGKINAKKVGKCKITVKSCFGQKLYVYVTVK